MISIRRTAMSAAILLLSTTASVTLAQQVDNPAYKAWAGFKPGSSETVGYTIESHGMKMDMDATSTLKEVTPDHVTIEVQSTMNMMGQKHTTPVIQRNIPAKVDPKDIKHLGEETVEAAGKSFKCQVMQAKIDQPGPRGKTTRTDAKLWVSSQVPGGIVKMEAASHGDEDSTGKVVSLLKSFDVK